MLIKGSFNPLYREVKQAVLKAEGSLLFSDTLDVEIRLNLN
jgi:hypothetical protein